MAKYFETSSKFMKFGPKMAKNRFAPFFKCILNDSEWPLKNFGISFCVCDKLLMAQIMENLCKLSVASCIITSSSRFLDIMEPMEGCNYHGFRSVISWTIYCLISYIEWGHYHQSLLSWLKWWRNMSYHLKPDHHHFIILTSSFWCSWSPSSSLRGQDQAPPKPATTTKTKTSVK